MSGKSHLRSLMESTERFFFAEESPYGLALVRMCLPTVALIPMVRRFFRVRELYSADGCPQQLAELFGNGRLLPELPGPVAAALYGLMLFGSDLRCFWFPYTTFVSDWWPALYLFQHA